MSQFQKQLKRDKLSSSTAKLLKVTTRLNSLQHGLNFQPLQKYHTLIRFKDDKNLSLLKNRPDVITVEEIAATQTFSQIAKEIYELLDGRIWAGHSIRESDKSWIECAFNDAKESKPVPSEIFDSCELFTETLQPIIGNVELNSLETYFGLSFNEENPLDEKRTSIAQLNILNDKCRSLAKVSLNIELVKQYATVKFLKNVSI